MFPCAHMEDNREGEYRVHSHRTWIWSQHAKNGNQKNKKNKSEQKTSRTKVEKEYMMDTQGDASPPSNASAAILENLITVSREYLSDGPPSSPGTVRSLRLVESRLTAVIQNSRASQSPLPDREDLPPNQRTWTETAERMGAKRQKRSHPTNSSSPAPPAAERIGMLNRKQPRVKNTDPYSGGLRSGKNAAPDARTAAQNADARARVASTTDGAEAPPSQSTKRRRKRASTPPPPPSSAPVPGPSAQFAWYPNAAYSQVPYHATYPILRKVRNLRSIGATDFVTRHVRTVLLDENQAWFFLEEKQRSRLPNAPVRDHRRGVIVCVVGDFGFGGHHSAVVGLDVTRWALFSNSRLDGGHLCTPLQDKESGEMNSSLKPLPHGQRGEKVGVLTEVDADADMVQGRRLRARRPPCLSILNLRSEEWDRRRWASGRTRVLTSVLVTHEMLMSAVRTTPEIMSTLSRGQAALTAQTHASSALHAHAYVRELYYSMGHGDSDVVDIRQLSNQTLVGSGMSGVRRERVTRTGLISRAAGQNPEKPPTDIYNLVYDS
ncbi:hypothetical protein EDB84DRAFT_1680663 [Lactarius hengduanensis]|nr:hypothetical protein EDB84DRAFT_1680663 [Lactarius hengduanensis]